MFDVVNAETSTPCVNKKSLSVFVVPVTLVKLSPLSIEVPAAALLPKVL